MPSCPSAPPPSSICEGEDPFSILPNGCSAHVVRTCLTDYLQLPNMHQSRSRQRLSEHSIHSLRSPLHPVGAARLPLTFLPTCCLQDRAARAACATMRSRGRCSIVRVYPLEQRLWSLACWPPSWRATMASHLAPLPGQLANPSLSDDLTGGSLAILGFSN